MPFFRRTAISTGRNASSGPLFVKTTVFHSFFLVVRFANVFQRPFFLVHVNYFFDKGGKSFSSDF
ncbi:hypothetical protein [Enterococcus durans]|uniref:hypothetical protein n=1 Tax=Enterococcus durans TaxID=53345 RepID=UPI001D1546DB|nr:hypothetical protein [Enterococcus durans]